MRETFYTYPSKLSFKSLKNVELVQANFVLGQFGIDVLMGNWRATFKGRRRKKNDKIMKQLWKQMLFWRKISVYFLFIWPSKLHSWNTSQWFLIWWKVEERRKISVQSPVGKMSHFLQHVEVITTFLLLCLDRDNFLLLGNITKAEFKSMLFYNSHLNYFPLQINLFFHVAVWRIYVYVW